ncbi:extracellular solute-binding protein [Streptomyces sp. 184]|uniref:ABC transporter substrate-binding protein n=1 Tax=Streptomyces sp. 184 TaxID=1827526 RepID=UPI00389227DE
MLLDRRQFLRTTGSAALGVTVGGTLAACGSSSGDGSPGTLTFSVWGSDAEIAAFNTLARAFEKKNGEVKVKVEQLPFDQMRQTLDARLQSEQGPDLFRVTYNDIGLYASQGVLLELGSAVGDQRAAFLDALWAGVQYEGKPYGIPHHTDTTAVVFNKDHFAAAGITDVPQALDEAWSWEEFIEVAERLSAKTGQPAFGVNWQQAGAFRWFNWLWQNGGRALSDDGKSSVLDSPEARSALAFTRSFYDDGLMPTNLMLKTNTSPDLVFPSGKISMGFVGDFLLADLTKRTTDFDFGVTYLPRGSGGAAADLGGNAVAVTTQSGNPEAATAFASFLAEPANMQAFCEKTTVLPARKELADTRLDFAVRPDLMPTYQTQATAIPTDLARLVTLPGFAAVNDALVQQLETFFTGGQSADDALGALSDALDEALAA